MFAQLISHTLAFGLGFLVGVGALFGYMLWRMMRNDDWDDSNITNAERLLSHVVLHPLDFGKMYYLNDAQRVQIGGAPNPDDRIVQRPFWYVSEDEFQGVVKTRPPE